MNKYMRKTMTQLSLRRPAGYELCCKPKTQSRFQVYEYHLYYKPSPSEGLISLSHFIPWFMDVLALDLPITFPTCRSSSCISFSSFWASRSSPPSIPCASSRSSKLDASQEVSNHQIQCFLEKFQAFFGEKSMLFSYS